MEYHKINTLYKRDSNNLIIVGDYSEPEYRLLANLKWEATEKVDGMNTRIMLIPEDGKYRLDFRGKSDRAVIPAMLKKHLETKYTIERVAAALNVDLSKEATSTYIIYGEGYGKGIQSGGGYISNDNAFIMFDVNIDGVWLKRESVEDIAEKLDAPIVPVIGYFTIEEAEEYVTKGFTSLVSEDKNLMAEGLVMRCPCDLRNRRGGRLICKIKYRDYNKLQKAKEDAKNKGVEFVQLPNEKYKGE